MTGMAGYYGNLIGGEEISCVCVSEHVCTMCVLIPTEVKDGVRLSSPGVIGDCKSPDKCAGT